MGFVEDVEFIMTAGAAKYAAPGAGAAAASGRAGCQTLLFSATLPEWVADVARRFLAPDRKMVDLVGSSKMKASASVRHLLLHCTWQARALECAHRIRVSARVRTGRRRGGRSGTGWWAT